MRTGVFIQVRLGSTRLPGKALLPLAGGTIIQHVMRAMKGVPAESRALLTDRRSADTLQPLAEAEGYAVLVGPDEDVLARYGAAARAFAVDRIVRATGDNPLTSSDLVRSLLREHEAADADLSHYLGCPLGTGVEVVRATALFDAEREAVLSEEREHITTWLYRNRCRYKVLEPRAPAGALLPGARVTVDTAEDYELVRDVFANLYHGRPIETEELVRYLASRAANTVDGGPARG